MTEISPRRLSTRPSSRTEEVVTPRRSARTRLETGLLVCSVRAPARTTADNIWSCEAFNWTGSPTAFWRNAKFQR